MKVKELLSDPKKWTKGKMAKNVDGKPVHELDVDATCWCLVGALSKCYQSGGYSEARRKLQRVANKYYGSYCKLVDVNDKGTYEEVMKIVVEADV